MGFTKRAKAVGVVNKMIKWAKEKDSVGSAVTNIKMPRIA